MDAGHERKAGRIGGDLVRDHQRVRVGVHARGDERRLEGDHPGAGERGGGAPVAGDVRGEEVDPGDAVDVQVDEPGHGRAGAAGGPHAHLGHRAVPDCHITLDELPADERGPDSESHRTPSLVYTTG